MAEELERNETHVDTVEADNSNDENRPRLVSGPAVDARKAREGADEPKYASSAHPMFVAQPWDGRNGDEEGTPAPAADTREAFKEYVQRPDIESREAILARENALPGQFRTVFPTADSAVVEDAEKNRDKQYKVAK